MKRSVLALVLGWAALAAVAAFPPAPSVRSISPDAQAWSERAHRTQRYTLRFLANLPRSDRCGWTPLIGYDRNYGSILSDAWYDAAQLQADVALGRLDGSADGCLVRKTAEFFDLLVVPPPRSGFYPRADVDGRNLSSRDVYADDNALLGLALLEARAASRDTAWRARLLDGAERAAGFLRDEMWDDTFGGGFWWNTRRGATGEGKPSQTAALAAQLFARLYAETGQPAEAAWAQLAVSWLDNRLRDPVSGLYYYTLRHWDMPNQDGEYLDPRVFSYDQGIMIEVFVELDRSVAPGAGYLERARALAEALDPTFWDDRLGGYLLTPDQPDVSAGYGAWLSQSLLALEAADHDSRWLAHARANLQALDRRLYDPADDGYFNLYFACAERKRIGCESGAAWSYDPTKYLVSQAWLERAQALLAARLANSQ